jgi:hypothetical protein
MFLTPNVISKPTLAFDVGPGITVSTYLISRSAETNAADCSFAFTRVMANIGKAAPEVVGEVMLMAVNADVGQKIQLIGGVDQERAEYVALGVSDWVFVSD